MVDARIGLNPIPAQLFYPDKIFYSRFAIPVGAEMTMLGNYKNTNKACQEIFNGQVLSKTYLLY